MSVLFAMVILAACQSSPEHVATSRTVVDHNGRTVSIPVKPNRVISLAPSITEVVFAAGADHSLAAVTTADNYPPSVFAIGTITAFPLDHEAVVARNPDLILATDQINAVRDIDAFSELGIPSFFLRFNSVADIFSAVRIVGNLLGTGEHADRAADSLESQWDDLLDKVDTTFYAPSVLLLVGYDALYAFGRDSYTDEMIAAAGGRSVTSHLEGQAATLSDEFVLIEQPEFIIGTFGADFDVGRILTSHPTWATLPAMANGNVYSIDPDLVSRPGPRIIDGTRTIAGWINGSKRKIEAP